MIQKNFISIIICTYNRFESLLITLKTIIPNNIDNFCEVIVVDNNSSDQTRSVVQSLSEDFRTVLRYVFEPNQGKVHALNTGINSAQGDLLVFTDDDVLWPENTLNKIRRTFDLHPECSVFGGKVVPILPENVSMPDWVYRQDPYNIAEGPLVDHDKGDETRSYYEPGMCVPVGAMLMTRRDVFDRLGLYEETRSPSGKSLPNEDSVWGSRLKKAGEPMLYIPDLVVQHVTDPSRLRKNYFRKHFWKSGEVCMLWSLRQDDAKNGRFLNVPRWFYLKFFRAVGLYVLSVVRRERSGLRFSKELNVVFFAAVLSAFWRDGVKRL